MSTHIDRIKTIDTVDLTESDAAVLPGQPAASARPATDDGVGCLRTGRGNLPLDLIDLRAVITGLASSTTLVQGFHNPHDEPLEATYIFPLPPRAAVTALRLEADGRVVDAVLKERGQARADYDAAISGGRRASIAEEERPGVFTMRVGNILPGERVSVHLTLAGELSYEDGAATFRFPLVVAPRYIPGAPLAGGQVGDGVEPDTDAVPDASRISPPVLLPGFPNPVRLSVTVDIDPAGLPLANVAASLHTVITERRQNGLQVRLEPGGRADRDFLLRLTFDADEAVSTSLSVLPDGASDGDPAGDPPDGPGHGLGGTFALAVLPPARAAQARNRDVVIVLDRSGSMTGWKMVAARRAAARIVDTLRGADRFAVLAFDQSVETPPSLPSGLVAANDRNRFRAVEFLSTMDARGGTEMLEPLRRAAELLGGQPGNAERDRVVVLVTDGQVGNEDQLLRELADGFAGVRVHTVGIDRAVNEGFLRRLAGQRGRCELVESEDRLDDAMRHIHRRIDAPVVTGLRLLPVAGTGLAVDAASLAPMPLPDLFPGAPVVITGRFTGLPTGVVTVAGDNAWQTTVSATPSDSPGLTALWARAHVRDLEDRYLGNRGNDEELEKLIVDTSLRYGVLSRFTAFVAVDQRVVNKGGTVHRVTQPVDLPSGWDAPTMLPPAVPYAMSAAPMAPARMAPARMARAPMAPAPEAGMASYGIATGGTAGLPSPGGPPTGSPGLARRRASASGRRAGPRPSPPGSPQSVPPRTGTLADFVATELAALRGRSGEEVWARAALLTALADRIRDSLPTWQRTGEPEPAIAALSALRDALAIQAADPDEVDRRWQHATATLEALGKTRTTDRARRPFWKR